MSVQIAAAMKRVISIFLFVFLHVAVTQGHITIFVDVPHDDCAIRSQLAELDRVKKQKLSFAKLEHLAVADRNKPRNGFRPPFNLECISKEALETRVGVPVEFDSSQYARPLAANCVVSPRNIKQEDIDGLVKRAKFYRLEGTGGIIVFFSLKGIALSPAITYLEVDADFPKLDAKDKMEVRLKWEESKIEKLVRWLELKPDEIIVSDKELHEHQESTKRFREMFNRFRQ